MKNSFRWIILLGGLTAWLGEAPVTMGPDVASSRGTSAVWTPAALARLAVPFVANRGQFEADVRFSADLFCGTLDVTDGAMVYTLRGRDTRTAVFREVCLDDSGRPLPLTVRGTAASAARISYFLGNDPASWQPDVPSYDQISLGEAWPGILVEMKASGRNVEKIFSCGPGSDPGRIRLRFEGARSLSVTPEGKLAVGTEIGEIALTAPVAYQEAEGARSSVPVVYERKGDHEYGFRVLAPYDKSRPLVIDPALEVLLASTFLGTAFTDNVRSIAFDGTGNIVGTGYQFRYNELVARAHVFRLKKDMTALLASTYFGGKRGVDGFIHNEGYSLAVGKSGNVYVAGGTNCRDFPVRPGAYDPAWNGSDDAFVVKFDSSLSGIVAATFLGPVAAGSVMIGLDEAENVYMTGTAYRKGFPVTAGAYDPVRSGSYQAFISKLNKTLSRLLASTLLGKTDTFAYACLLSQSGHVYVCGKTVSKDFPTTSGAYDRSHNGGSDVFVSKLDLSLKSLAASTLLGGRSMEGAKTVALDAKGNVFLAGWTLSSNFPVTAGAFDPTINDSWPNAYDGFISKLDASLGRLLGSTFLGGEYSDDLVSIALNRVGDVYVTGSTDSDDFPATPGSYDPDRPRSSRLSDGFVSKFNNTLTRLLVSTFLGGASGDQGKDILIDSVGDIYVAGWTESSDFPVSPTAYDKTYNGDFDIFVSKFRH